MGPNESLHNVPATLRRTSRLQEHLKGLGYGIFEQTNQEPWIRMNLPNSQAPDSVFHVSAPHAVPPDFSFWILERLTARHPEVAPRLWSISDVPGRVYWRERDNTLTLRNKLTVPRGDRWVLDDQSIDVWWLSATEFLSPVYLEYRTPFAVEFSFDKSRSSSSIKLYAYHIDNITNMRYTISGWVVNSNPATSMYFLKHLVAREIDKISRIDFQLISNLVPSAVFSMLSIIPANVPGENTALDRKSDLLHVSIGPCPFLRPEHMEAVIPYPFHQNVRLEFGKLFCSPEQYSSFLARLQHVRHLVVPGIYNGTNWGDMYKPNPMLESLTIDDSFHQRSIKELESNTNYRALGGGGSLILQNDAMGCTIDNLYHQHSIKVLASNRQIKHLVVCCDPLKIRNNKLGRVLYLL
jgi:hypothetical protein